MILHDWKADVPATHYYYAIYESGTSFTAPWNNPQYDGLLKKARSAGDARQQARLYQEADELLTRKNTVMIPLYYAAEPVLVSSKVRGFHQDIYNAYDYSEIRLP
jgi:oligopeptide transport system substrate-binding protein